MDRFDTFLFDLDGTLIDHFSAIHRAHSHTLQVMGLPAPSLEQVRSAVGGGLELAIGRLAGTDRVQEALAIYRPYWDATMLDDVQLLPGARSLLERLHRSGSKTAVLTNKHGPSSRRICQHLGLSPFLNGVYGALDTPWLKPQREFAQHALNELSSSAEGTLLVGDSPWDVQAGKNGGFPSWCVTTGTHSFEELTVAGADRVFVDLVHLDRALLEGN
jgi:phosphoglycolate phosphatase-like HAD superfamily hydrolase